jgi:thiol-disulfide isomerase/thioredoxin
MFTKFRFSVFALVLASSCASQASPELVKSFDKSTWTQMTHAPSRPSVVVFTTTDCSFCPDVIDALAKDVRQQGKARANLFVVVMDGAGQSSALLKNAHYRRVDGLYAFNGQDLALRYSVNPDWRGLTPYVAMIPKHGAPQFVTGRPSDVEMNSFLAVQ